MKLFYKVIFVERGRDIPMQLVSIGMVREDGTSLYLVNEESLSNVARHPWLSVTAWPRLPARMDPGGILEWDRDHQEHKHVVALDRLIDRVREFITETPQAELWAWYGCFDHVVLTQLFGPLAENPAGIPMYTRELCAFWEDQESPDIPAEPADHHALDDARWARSVYLWITDPKALTTEEMVDAEVVEDEEPVRSIGIIGHVGAGKTEITNEVKEIAPTPVFPKPVASDDIPLIVDYTDLT